MKFVKFKKFFPLGVDGSGFREGDHVLLTDSQIHKMAIKSLEMIGLVDISDVLPAKRWRPGDPSPKSLGWYYPAGIGDACMHTAFVKALKEKNPLTRIVVAANGPTAAVWHRNPHIDMFAPRIGHITKDFFDAVEQWVLLEDVLYNLDSMDQKNCYEEIAKAAGFEPAGAVPDLHVAASEMDALYIKLARSFEFKDIVKQRALVLLFLEATKANRAYPELFRFALAEDIAKRYGDTHAVVCMNGSENFMVWTENKELSNITFPNITVREAMVLIQEAAAVVTVDSAALHIAAGLHTPTVALLGPFSPKMRTVTYSNVKHIWHQEDCSSCPCCWHDDGYPETCPGKKECVVIAGITHAEILDKLDQALCL